MVASTAEVMEGWVCPVERSLSSGKKFEVVVKWTRCYSKVLNILLPSNLRKYTGRFFVTNSLMQLDAKIRK